MRSEVRITGGSWKLHFTIGLFLTVLVIALAFFFRSEVSIILLIGAGIFAISGCIRVLKAIDEFRMNRRLRIQEVRLATYKADKAEMDRYIASYPRTQRIVTLQDAPIRIIETVAEAQSRALLPSTTKPIDMLDALDGVQRGLIVGASDSGKTTVLQWIISRRLQSSKVVVIDPHASPGKWEGCIVVGTGRDYLEIEKALDALIQLMTTRYDDIGQGKVAEGQHRKITILIDEWRAIVANVRSASAAIKALLTESRKAAFSVFLTSHSDRAKPLGLEGEYDLKDGFAVARLSIANGHRRATLDTGDGEIPVMLPGPFNGHSPPAIDTGEFINLEPEPTPTEAMIVQMHEQGASHAKICEEVWGYKSSNKYPEIDRVLRKLNRK